MPLRGNSGISISPFHGIFEGVVLGGTYCIEGVVLGERVELA